MVSANRKEPSTQVSPGKTLCKALSRIQEIWELSNVEMARFVHASRATYGNWIKNGEIPSRGAPLSPEVAAVVDGIAIYRNLAAMFLDAKDQLLWLKTVHPDFRGQTPFEFACHSVQNLYWLRSYLDYVKGRGA